MNRRELCRLHGRFSAFLGMERIYDLSKKYARKRRLTLCALHRMLPLAGIISILSKETLIKTKSPRSNVHTHAADFVTLRFNQLIPNIVDSPRALLIRTVRVECYWREIVYCGECDSTSSSIAISEMLRQSRQKMIAVDLPPRV